MLTFPFKKYSKSLFVATSNLVIFLIFCGIAPPTVGQDFGSPQPQVIFPEQVLPPQQVIPADLGVQPAPVIPSQSVPAPRTAAKPVINSNSSEVVGATYIALDSRLKQVFRGSEPRSLTELRAMNDQQAKVAAVVDKVTVNVQQGSAQGSGVIISGDGYILTAAHVAGKPNRRATVRFSDGSTEEATTCGMDRNNDAGLIKIKNVRLTTGSNPTVVAWPHATMGSSEHLKEGQWCIAAGHPGGFQQKRGSVIRVGRILSIKGQPANTLFTDCTLIGGDSGGPLFTLEGKLIGIHSRIGTDMEDNMHVPIEVYERGWTDLKEGKAWGVLPGFKPLIGVIGRQDTTDAIVEKVVANSPAEVAGLVVGDLIRSFDGVKVKSFADLQAAVEQTLPGDTVFIEVVRDGEKLRFPLVVGIEGE